MWLLLIEYILCAKHFIGTISINLYTSLLIEALRQLPLFYRGKNKGLGKLHKITQKGLVKSAKNSNLILTK